MAGGVIDGTPVDAANTNPKFIYKDFDDSSSGVLGLANANVASGSSVTSLQKEHNSAASFMGKALNAVYNSLPTFTNNQGMTATQSLYAAIDFIRGLFNNTTGHTHDGSGGSGGPISGGSLTGVVPTTSGGTNNNQLPSNGAVLYSDATKFLLTSVGSAGQFLQSTGAGAPIWAAGNSAPVITGSLASPQNITAAGGIAFTGSAYDNIWFIQGNAGDVTITANPKIAAGTLVGQRLFLIAVSDSQKVIINNGTGVAIIGQWVGAALEIIGFVWDGSKWAEQSRNNPVNAIEFADQTVAGGDTIFIDNYNSRAIKKVKGTAGGSTASATIPISTGQRSNQEIILIGNSDTDTLTIPSGSSVLNMNGDITLKKGTVFCVLWDEANSTFNEMYRSM